MKQDWACASVVRRMSGFCEFIKVLGKDKAGFKTSSLARVALCHLRFHDAQAIFAIPFH